MPKPTLTPSAPKRLVRAFRRAKWKWHTLARNLDVNPSYLYNFLHNGREPTNPEIRARMFLKRHQRAPVRRVPTAMKSPAARWWNKLTKANRARLVESLHHEQERFNARKPATPDA
jgi:hypothetical protein